jgi:hypothetical protein
MGIETSTEHGGAESSFTSAIIAIEELAKVDPSVSVLCDVHNTLVNTIFRTYGSKEQQDKWLPLLSESKVLGASRSIRIYVKLISVVASLAHSVCPNQHQVPTPSLCRPGRQRTGTTGLSTAQKCGSRIPMKPMCS